MSTRATNALGYCHKCDRQVPLTSDYSCSVCNGGFVEILDETPIAQPIQTRTTRSTAQSQSGAPQFFFHSQVIPQQHGGQTRVQVLVPGEQFDLYGIMNHVLSDLFNPQASGGAGGTAQANFGGPIRMFQLHGDLRDYALNTASLDAIITQLLSQLENTGPPPATENQLHNLPVLVINQKQIDENVQCSICMEDFNLNDEAKQLPCKHFFHDSCISQWLKLHGTCPVCRKTLNGEDTSQREYVSPENTAAAAAAAAAATGGQSTPATASNVDNSAHNNTTNANTPNSNTRSSNNNSNNYYDPMDFD